MLAVMVALAISSLLLSVKLAILIAAITLLLLTYALIVRRPLPARTELMSEIASEQQLRLAEQIFKHTTEGIIMTDAAGYIIAVNPAFTEITGFTSEEAIGKKCPAFREIEKGEALGLQMQADLQNTGCWRGQLPGYRKGGQIYPAWGSLSVVRDEQGEVSHHVTVFSDFTERKKAEEHLQFLASRDVLTGLYNRSALQDQLVRAVHSAAQQSSCLALFFVDLDRFKAINDSMGHAVGDELLQVIALRLRFCLKERDFIVRFGGDEFIILIEHAPGDEELAAIAKRIVSEMARPCLVRGIDLFITCSVGISRYPCDAKDENELLRSADAAMYRAKELGKNMFQFHAEDMSSKVNERNLLENSLRMALKRQQFVLYYQPQYDLTGESFYGCEALIRWHHPELGMVPPASFIPLAEECGMIDAIGEWVIRDACQQIRRWLDVGFDPQQVSVNLSPCQFKQSTLIKIIQSALNDANVPPEKLTLEVTESVIMQEPEQASQLLGELRAMGIKVAIDDFGSGYSSLAYLKLLPLDTLKIDRAFIAPLPADQDSVAIVEAVVAMSRKLKLTVVAEGVETDQQSSLLRHIGCDVAQGYLYNRPLPADLVPAAFCGQAFQLDN